MGWMVALGATLEDFVDTGVARTVRVIGVRLCWKGLGRWCKPKALAKPLRSVPTPDVYTVPTLERDWSILNQSNQPLHIILHVQGNTRRQTEIDESTRPIEENE